MSEYRKLNEPELAALTGEIYDSRIDTAAEMSVMIFMALNCRAGAQGDLLVGDISLGEICQSIKFSSATVWRAVNTLKQRGALKDLGRNKHSYGRGYKILLHSIRQSQAGLVIADTASFRA